MSDTILSIGGQMATMMYNLSQGANLPAGTRDLMRDMHQRWDAAISADSSLSADTRKQINDLRSALTPFARWPGDHPKAKALTEVWTVTPHSKEKSSLTISDFRVARAVLDATTSTPQPLLVGSWLPIERADKTITDVQSFPEIGMTISMSDRYWVRDEDGRVYEAAWSEGNNDRDFWWDFEGESPVDPIEFMPHPLDPRFNKGQTDA